MGDPIGIYQDFWNYKAKIPPAVFE